MLNFTFHEINESKIKTKINEVREKEYGRAIQVKSKKPCVFLKILTSKNKLKEYERIAKQGIKQSQILQHFDKASFSIFQQIPRKDDRIEVSIKV